MNSLIVLIVGCRAIDYPEGAPQTIAFETDHHIYYSDEEFICPSLGERIEEDYLLGRDFLDIVDSSDNTSEKFRYFYYGDEYDLGASCLLDGAIGCFQPPTDVLSSVWLHRHELIHAYTYTLGNPPSFFKEGLAEIMGPMTGDEYVRVQHNSVDVLAMIQNESELDYATSAAFTRFLIDDFGLDKFILFYKTASFGSLIEDFEGVFGVSLDDAIEAWMNLGSSYRGDAYFWLAECGSEPLDMSWEDPVVLTPQLTCDQVPLGINHIDDQIGAYRTIEVENKGAIHFTLTSDEEEGLSGVYIRGCDRYLEGEPGVYIDDSQYFHTSELWVEVDEGKYFFNVWNLNGGGESSTIQIEKTRSPLADSCGDAGLVVVDGKTGLLRLDGSTNESGLIYVWLQAAENVAFEVSTSSFEFGEGLPNEYATNITICSGECASLDCEEFEGDTADLMWGGIPLSMQKEQLYLLEVEFSPLSHIQIDLSQ